MPHRITQLSSASLWVIDGVALGFATFLAIFEELSFKDLTGPNGFLIASIAVCWVLWKNGQSRDKQDAELRERHHAEMMTMTQESNQKLAELSAESIKASFMVAAELGKLKGELGKRPCCIDIEPK